MRYAARSRNTFSASAVIRLCATVFAAAALSACSTLGISGDRQPADITGDTPDEVNWSFANATKLQSEIAQLKSENARLRTQLKAVERQKSEAERAAALSAENGAARDAQEAAREAARAQAAAAAGADRSPALKTAVVAAADADQALADAPPPVSDSPRLVQPSFSDEQPVFENEAPNGDIRLSSVLYGVHLASYRAVDEARAGWQELQRENPDELGLLEPRIERVSVPERGVFLRLIGGGFSSKDKAASLCQRLKQKQLYCAVASFDGERLSLADASG
ncbi:MAG: SPOR domain-containing protein [Pseudomonadota bacterium]